MAGQIHVGTSGWHYAHWRGRFYPEHLPAERMLRFYCQRFHTVEINSSFYHLPERKTFRSWARQTPANFFFAVKASRYLTHMKKLKEPRAALQRFLSHARGLGAKLGPILCQLPPRWGRDAGRLACFLEALPKEQRAAFEFRDPSWFHPDIYALLEKHRAAFCVYDLAGLESPRRLTTDFAYLRLHGPSPERYAGCYTRRQLGGWLEICHKWIGQGAAKVYVYFDNDQGGYAARNALELQELAGQI